MNVDDEGGVSVEDAIEWLRRAYGLSKGAARAELEKALDSGNVDWGIPSRLNYLLAASLFIFGYACIFDDRFVHDLRLNLDDLKWQIDQQLGAKSEPPSGATEKASAGHQREAYLKWLRPFALERHTLGFVPKDIALQARDHGEAETLPGQLRSVIEAVEKILAADERAHRKRA